MQKQNNNTQENHKVAYQFTFRCTIGDFFRYRMENVYRNWIGFVEILFTVIFLILIIFKWNDTNAVGKTLLVVFTLLFPVIQPLCIYIAARRDVSAINKEDTTLTFEDTGLHIQVKDHKQFIMWRDFYPIIKRPAMLVVTPDGIHAYLLTNRILKDKKQEVYDYCMERIRKYSKHGNVKLK